MHLKRHGFRTLGLSLFAAISLVAAVAGSAQAGEFRLGGKTFSADGVAFETILATIGKGELLTVSGLKLFCASGTGEGTVLLGGIAHVKVLYNGCEFLGDKNCLIFENKMNDELDVESGHIFAAGLGEVILHGSSHYLKITSSTEPLSFYYVGNHLGKKLCARPLENEIGGSLALLLPHASEESLIQTAETVKETVDACGNPLLGVQLKYGNENMDLAEGTVTEAHLANDAKWGAE